MKNQKTKKNLLAFLGIILSLFLSLFTSCFKKTEIKINLKNQDNFYLDPEIIWDQKIRFLSETDSIDFSNPLNLSKKYILKVCQYYKILSSSNIDYDNKINKYIISEIELKEIVKNLFGIENFKFEDEKFFDKKNGFYFFDEYISFFDDKTYEKKEVSVLDDQRLKFKVVVTDNKTKLKHDEYYILKKDNKNNYYIASKESK
ncbi:MAG: hypothetical protein J6C55_00610 [Oscillospiraceae bacterium]|nr:hypothetical protein [Oscillospiraceae bacterium]